VRRFTRNPKAQNGGESFWIHSDKATLQIKKKQPDVGDEIATLRRNYRLQRTLEANRRRIEKKRGVGELESEMLRKADPERPFFKNCEPSEQKLWAWQAKRARFWKTTRPAAAELKEARRARKSRDRACSPKTQQNGKELATVERRKIARRR
jgi:hypothetical protein